MSRRTTVFVSYSRTDSRWLQRLQVHLKPFARRGDLVLWDDTKIDPGDRWRSAIRDAIERAAASVLLISPSSRHLARNIRSDMATRQGPRCVRPVGTLS